MWCGDEDHYIFAECCRIKEIVNKEAVKAFCEEEPSDSSDTESLCGVKEVGAVEDKHKRRPIRCIKVEKCEFQVLVDTGVTVNVMDKCTFSTVTGCQGHTESISSVLHAFQTDESPMVPLKVIGKFDVMVESGKRVALATFHVIKGCMNTEPLIGFKTCKDLDLVLVGNSFQLNGTVISKLVGEYADLFKGIGKMKGVQVDLHVDPAILPVAQPHRRPKLEVELEKLMGK